MENIKNIPPLRFPEFNGEWGFKKLRETCDFTNGKAHENEINEHGKYIVVNSKFISSDGKVKKFSNKQIVPLYKDDIVMVMSDVPNGKALAKCYLIESDEKYTLNQRICVLRTNKFNNSFLIYLINRNKFYLSFDSGVGQTNLKKEDVLNCPFYIPSSLQEQTKIATFLTAVDDKLQVLRKKKTLLEQYKKGVMQKIFSQELRFKDDNGNDYPEWEEKKLGDCLDYIQPTKYLVSSTEYDNSYSTPVLTAGKTFILGYTNETNGIFENNLPVIIFDDFTTATQFVDFPFKAKSSAMKILIANEGINIKFIYEAMGVINYEVGGHERHWISKFAPLEIDVPCLEEQTKIANFLSAIDDKINHCQSQIEKMEVWKKGLLQQMFV